VDIDTVPTIIAAKLGLDGEKREVFIWQKMKKHVAPEQVTSPAPSIDCKASLAEICMFVASPAFLWQNMAVRVRNLHT
jgi:hypothetical protein